MIVVADSSPIIVLINISQIDVLPQLFGQVVVPREVSGELRLSIRPQAVRDFMGSPPIWFLEKSANAVEPIPSLHEGECAAICLAQELKADFLLIDEALGRKKAAERGIPIAGTIGVLELAAAKGLLDLGDVFARVKATDFWISHDLLDERLDRFLSFQKLKEN